MRREAAATPGLERSRRQLLRQRALFLVASRPRLPGQWVFFSPGRYRKLQTCANQAAPLSLTLSKLLIAPMGVFVLTSETAIPPPYPVVYIRSKWAPLLRPFTWSGFDL